MNSYNSLHTPTPPANQKLVRAFIDAADAPS